jgi:pyrophosphatase PpaX
MIRTILFDLDGTILDTNELIIQSFMFTLEGKAVIPFSREDIISHMGKPLTEQLQLFSGREEIQDLLTAYRKFYYDNHDALVTAFPQVKEVVSQLHGMGIKLGVVTSKIQKTSLLGLKLCGIDTYMHPIITIEDVVRPKPHPEGIQLALKAIDGEPESTIMVGDSQYDIQAGQAAGVTTVGVAWSLKGQELLQSFKPDYIIQDMRELIALVATTTS